MSMRKQDAPQTLAELYAQREAARPKIWLKAKPDELVAVAGDGAATLELVRGTIPISATLRDLAEARFLAMAMATAIGKGHAKDAKAALALILKSKGWARHQADLNTARAGYEPRLGDSTWIPGGGNDWHTRPAKVAEFAEWVRDFYREAIAPFRTPATDAPSASPIPRQ